MRRIELSDEDHATIAAMIKSRRDTHNAYATPNRFDRTTDAEIARERELEKKFDALLFRFNEATHV